MIQNFNPLSDIQLFDTSYIPQFHQPQFNEMIDQAFVDIPDCNDDSSDFDIIAESLKQKEERGISTPTVMTGTNTSKSNGLDSIIKSEYSLEGEDLNKEVEKILNSKPIESLLEDGIQIDSCTLAELSVNKRRRKTKEQIKSLKEMYSKFTNWEKNDIEQIAGKLKMSFSQVYKWHWDQTKKQEKRRSNKVKKSCK